MTKRPIVGVLCVVAGWAVLFPLVGYAAQKLGAELRIWVIVGAAFVLVTAALTLFVHGLTVWRRLSLVDKVATIAAFLLFGYGVVFLLSFFL